jgi:hypothetical protein
MGDQKLHTNQENTMFYQKRLRTTIMGAVLSVVALPALATPIYTTGSTTILGTTFGFGPSAMPWVAEVFASNGQCLRLAVTNQATDLEMVVVAPNGTVYRDDDSGGNLRPLVKIPNTPNNGWYTVRINHFGGNAVSSNFTLLYQRLSQNNAACLPSTTPRSIMEDGENDMKLNEMPTSEPMRGHPGYQR